MSIDLSGHPHCAERLRLNRTNINDDSMNAYWAALCVAEDFSDKRLSAHGGINFWTMEGPTLLDAMEGFLVTNRHAKTFGIPKAEFERLKAFLGSQGVKASKLKSDDDFWTVATALWGRHIQRFEHANLSGLLSQILDMEKAERKRIAKINRPNIPERFRP